MKLGFSGEAFGNLLVLNAFIVIIIVFVAIWIALKRGINIYSTRFQLGLLFGCVLIFCIVPLLLSDLAIKWKIIAAIAALSGGLANFLGTGIMQKTVKEQLDKRKKKD
jgi:hypothetical protein